MFQGSILIDSAEYFAIMVVEVHIPLPRGPRRQLRESSRHSECFPTFSIAGWNVIKQNERVLMLQDMSRSAMCKI
jgi:hypothetical protein